MNARMHAGQQKDLQTFLVAFALSYRIDSFWRLLLMLYHQLTRFMEGIAIHVTIDLLEGRQD